MRRSAWHNLSMLAVESQQVILLRMMKLCLGGEAATAEAKLMVSEKLFAAGEAAGAMMMGGSADAVVGRYRRRVRANARRLQKV